MATKIKCAIKVLILTIIFSLGIGYIYAWTGPNGAPPTQNVSAPLNVGSTTQDKEGKLRINTSLTSPFVLGLEVFGSAFVENNVGIGIQNPSAKIDVDGAVRIRGGNPTEGKVLTAINDSGDAVWQSVPASSNEGYTFFVLNPQSYCAANIRQAENLLSPICPPSFKIITSMEPTLVSNDCADNDKDRYITIHLCAK